MYPPKFHKKFKITALLVVVVSMLSLSFSRMGFRQQAAVDYYTVHLDSLQQAIERFRVQADTASVIGMKQLFATARHHYKTIEFLVTYHYPSTAQRLNGPPLLDSKPSEPLEPLHPTGFQVLEEKIYRDSLDRNAVRFELSNIENRIRRLKLWLPELELTQANVLDALRLNIYSVISLGIPGFDSPVALNSIAEAKTSLQAMNTMIKLYDKSDALQQSLHRAVTFIDSSGFAFNSFDRAVFISRFINPVSEQLLIYQQQHNIPYPEQHGAVSAVVGSMFHPSAFSALYYAPSGTVLPNRAQLTLGKALFSEKLLSANGKRSCATCHDPGNAFTDGLKVNEAITGDGKLLRNTSSLINAALQPAQFYDSRIAFLEDQVHDVIVSKHEMGGHFEKIVAAINKERKYKPMVQAAYQSDVITKDIIRTALAGYVRSLVDMNTRFDDYMRGNPGAMSPQELQGFNLFMGKAKCGTCHFMPLFSGVVPPLYDRVESEVLGVPAYTDTLHPVADADPGTYSLHRIPHQMFSFKTPTVRSIANTAPYMHNGVYQTLQEVIDFYDRGGGKGMGLNIPHQTLPATRLHLTASEKQAIISFMQALSSGSK